MIGRKNGRIINHENWRQFPTLLSKLGEISDNFLLNVTVKYQNIAQFEIPYLL